MGIGASMRGVRPGMELMFWSVYSVAFDQILNNAANVRYMSGGKINCPIVIRGPANGGTSVGATHSHTPENIMANFPGMKCVCPSNAYDAKGMLKTAIRDDNPTIVVMNKKMLGVKGPVPEELYAIPMGQANIVREGSDITVVAIGRMVVEATKAAATLEAEGISVEIIDPRTVQPLDTPAIIASVKKTNRALVVHEAVGFGGIGAEISAQITEQAFDYLDAPVARVTAPFSPSPYAPILENAYMPDANRIAADIRAVFGRG
jgi:pyruvate dehydrogenase E1 component beta subunit